MIRVETAVRAWVQPPRFRRKKTSKKSKPWRRAAFDERVLVFDTETTIDFSLRLQVGIFRLYVNHEVELEGIFYGDSMSVRECEIVREFAAINGIGVYTRTEFVERIFFHYVYGLGALCVGFNLPFDLSRIATRAGAGRGENRRRFRLTLTTRMGYCALHVEAISGRAAFIQFARRNNLKPWEKPFFRGRFLDLSTLATALSGGRYSLKRAAKTYKTEHQKSATETLGQITLETLEYCRNDVIVTWELFEKLRTEYLKYPFASMENERLQAPLTVPITRIYSTASIAKAMLSCMGFVQHMADDGSPE